MFDCGPSFFFSICHVPKGKVQKSSIEIKNRKISVLQQLSMFHPIDQLRQI